MMTNKKRPTLQLFPNLLGDLPHHELFLPASVDRAIQKIDGLICESEKAGRRFLSRFDLDGRRPQDVTIALLNEHADGEMVDFLLEPILAGERWGVISDGGLPCIADPGADLVRRARQKGVVIQAFTGPSSVMLALMLSGMSGQRFAFHGYLERHPDKRKQRVPYLEQQAKEDKATQIFIETPYRNDKVLDDLLAELSDEIQLCIAWDLTLPTQGVLSQKVALWKKHPRPNIHKKPAVFLIAE